MSVKNSQVGKMIAFAEANGSITNYDAVYSLGILSPTRRICDIKAMGYSVSKRRESIVDKNGEEKWIVRYFIRKETA